MQKLRDHLLQSAAPFYSILVLRSFKLDTQNQYLLLKLEVFSLASKSKRTGISWLFCAVSISELPEKKISSCFCNLIKCRHLSVLKWTPLCDRSHLLTPCKFLLKKRKTIYFRSSSLSSGHYQLSLHWGGFYQCTQNTEGCVKKDEMTSPQYCLRHLHSCVLGVCQLVKSWEQKNDNSKGVKQSPAKNSGALPDSDVTCSTKELNQKNYHLSLFSPNTAVIKRACSDLVSATAAQQEWLSAPANGRTISCKAL